MLHDALITTYATASRDDSILYCDADSSIVNLSSPARCLDWELNSDYLYDITITSNNLTITNETESCQVYEPTLEDIANALSNVVLTFTVLDQIVYWGLAFYVACFIILVILGQCRPQRFRAVRLKTYNAILQAKGK